MIASEIVKAQSGRGRNRELYYFRDQQGLEVDFAIPSRRGAITLVECKAAKAARPSDAASMMRLADAFEKRSPAAVTPIVVHRGSSAVAPLRPKATAMGWRAFSALLNE